MKTQTVPNMTLAEIQSAVLTGNTVYTGNPNYVVVHDSIGQWLIVSKANGYTIGLTWTDGKTLNSYGDFHVVTR